MDQTELRDLLLTLAAQASSDYEKVLIDRNSKFEEITLISHKMEQLKEENEDTLFSPRNKLSAYDEKITLEQDYKKEKMELGRLDGLLDTMLNRKEELLEGIELLDSIIEERDELSAKVKELESKSLNTEPDSDDDDEEVNSSDTEKDDVTSSEDGNDFMSAGSNNPGADDSDDEEIVPDVKQVMDALSLVAYQCGEIANYTIQDPYRARNELRAISVKWGN